MIGLLVISALLQGVAASAADPGIQAFKEACVEGTLKLSPDTGRVLKEGEITNFVDIFDPGRATTRRIVIKLNKPAETYLVLADYSHVQPKSIANSCALISATISHEQAAAAFLEGLPDRNLLPYWIPNMNLPIWTADHPELGYQKRLRFRNDGSIVLMIGLYPANFTNRKSEAKQQ